MKDESQKVCITHVNIMRTSHEVYHTKKNNVTLKVHVTRPMKSYNLRERTPKQRSRTLINERDKCHSCREYFPSFWSSVHKAKIQAFHYISLINEGGNQSVENLNSLIYKSRQKNHYYHHQRTKQPHVVEYV